MSLGQLENRYYDITAIPEPKTVKKNETEIEVHTSKHDSCLPNDAK